ncbi:MAG: hypothetical protein JXR80_00370 [Deltaproteobacteria bacterium]|nr:hypothetical protein [Deltaproteobacteria bacterium]
MSEEPNLRLPIRIVAALPDLMVAEDYLNCSPDQKKIRVRISFDDNGVAILGDSLHVAALEKLLADSGANCLERTLCG